MPRRARPLLALGAALALAPAAAGAPIPSQGTASGPAFRGAAARPRPVPATRPPQNPFLTPDPSSNIHNDTWMTDAYARRRGPLGRRPRVLTRAYPPGLCGSLAFDSRGRIVTVCPSAVAPPRARVIDPRTLAERASYDLPTAPDPPGTRLFQNFTGGGYFFLDGRDRIWSATKTSHLVELAERDDGRRLTEVADYDLARTLRSDERITSALPDFHGRVWFVSRRGGVVGVLDPRLRRIRIRRTGEEIENSFAVDRDAVYVVSDRRMYRWQAGRDGRPRVAWSARYRNSGKVKPSQVDAGSGTTPTIMAGGFVAITDNADPMNVVVYRRATHLRRGERRVVCEVPVFDRGASATENSLMTANRALVVENNYGYRDPFGPRAGALTRPGFARMDVRRDGRGCRRVWTNRTERAPSVVPKLSARTGLIYTYTRDRDRPGVLPWSWTAIDFRTGRTRWKRRAGTGPSFNNNYAGIALGRDGSAYLGVIGGMIRLRDG